MDEPTDVLTPQADEFFEILQTEDARCYQHPHHAQAERDFGCDIRVAIIRRGKIVGQVKTTDTNEQELADLMVGRAVSFADKAEVERVRLC